jgi:hypothetical protein
MGLGDETFSNLGETMRDEALGLERPNEYNIGRYS